MNANSIRVWTTLLFMVLALDNNAQTWTQLADYPDSLGWYGVGGFSVNGKGYVGGAGGNGSMFFHEFYEYDPYTDAWTQKASFPDSSGRRTVASFSISDSGYVGLGWTGSTSLKSLYRYDPATDQWSRKADYGGKAGRTMYYTSLNGKGYVGGGSIGVGDYQKDFWEYDPVTDSWTQKADMPSGRVAGVAFAIDSLVYIVCGRANSTHLNDLWAYSPATDSWSQKTNFPGAGRINPIGFVLNGKAVVGGGYFSSSGVTRLNDYYEYDPVTNLWTPISGFVFGNRSVGSSFTIYNEGYTCMGIDSTGSGYRKDLWKYSHCKVDYTMDAMTFCDTVVSPSGNFNWTTAGIYNDTALNSKGCDSLLIIELTGGVIDKSITPGAVTLSSNESGADSYQWILCDDSSGIIPNDTNQTLVNFQFGLSYAVIIEKYGCVDTSECVFLYPVGIDKSHEEDEIRTFPNPNSGEFTIELPKVSQRIDISLINSSGQIIRQWNFSDQKSVSLSTIVSAGLYTLIIVDDKGMHQKKLMVE